MEAVEGLLVAIIRRLEEKVALTGWAASWRELVSINRGAPSLYPSTQTSTSKSTSTSTYAETFTHTTKRTTHTFHTSTASI